MDGTRWVIAVRYAGKAVRYYTGCRNEEDAPLLARTPHAGALAYSFEMSARRDLALARRALPHARLSVQERDT